jgi:hypothetical protein
MVGIPMFNANAENTTILLPIANNLTLSNECISHLVNHSPCKIIVLYDFHDESDYIQNEKVKYVKNEDAKGLVRIWNKCINICPTEYVVLTGWRSRPTEKDFIKMFDKLNEGFGMVALKSLHFFAFSKHLLTKVGFFDTGFTTGQMEDTDFFNRCCLENIGIYVSDEMHEVSYQSTWLANPNPNIIYYKNKWREEPPNLIMLKVEENYNDRDIYSSLYTDRKYKSFGESELFCPSVNNYFKNIFTNYTKLYN